MQSFGITRDKTRAGPTRGERRVSVNRIVIWDVVAFRQDLSDRPLQPPGLPARRAEGRGGPWATGAGAATVPAGAPPRHPARRVALAGGGGRGVRSGRYRGDRGGDAVGTGGARHRRAGSHRRRRAAGGLRDGAHAAGSHGGRESEGDELSVDPRERGARVWASLPRVRAAHERRRRDRATGLPGVAVSGALRRPMLCVARVVGDTQRRPGGREKRGVIDVSSLLVCEWSHGTRYADTRAARRYNARAPPWALTHHRIW